MLQTGVFVQLLLALTLARGGAHPPRTVVDYYLLLPSKYFEGLATDTRSERMRLFRDFKGSFIDRQHGFLHIRGDGAQPDLNVCIFKRTDGTYLAAVNSNTDSDGQWEPFLDFYVYRAGHLVNFTRPMRPQGLSRNLGFVLPRYGQTIKVVNENGRTLYGLHWTGMMFVKPAGR